ncbi:hypothetical protein Syun_026949 [Stephania yunnanensis]|uniref:Uncharacterized protein n=1 Tax=Stephania yunnanensis TaxID=152371 RepID=A0AAP0HKL1_9MAGN
MERELFIRMVAVSKEPRAFYRNGSGVPKKLPKNPEPRTIHVALERRWSLEVAIEKVIGHDLDTGESIQEGNGKDVKTNIPILEREYMQGILISELVLSDHFSPSTRKSRRRNKRHTKEIKRLGETIIKGHKSYNLMLSLQLGISVALSVGDWFFDRVGVSAIDCPYPFLAVMPGLEVARDLEAAVAEEDLVVVLDEELSEALEEVELEEVLEVVSVVEQEEVLEVVSVVELEEVVESEVELEEVLEVVSAVELEEVVESEVELEEGWRWFRWRSRRRGRRRRRTRRRVHKKINSTSESESTRKVSWELVVGWCSRMVHGIARGGSHMRMGKSYSAWTRQRVWA